MVWWSDIYIPYEVITPTSLVPNWHPMFINDYWLYRLRVLHIPELFCNCPSAFLKPLTFSTQPPPPALWENSACV